MGSTKQLRDQHAELVAVVQELRGRLKPDQVVEQTPDILALLIRYSGKLRVHLKAEEDKLYPAMIGSGDPDAMALAQSYQEEMGSLVESFEGFMTAWRSPLAIEQDPAGFCDATRSLLTVPGDRIERENRELYPLAERL